MATELILPEMGEGVTEGTVARWLKAEGEPVKLYEPIVEVETDKVTTEITAEAAGTLLEIRVPAGETVAVDTVLAVIGSPGESTGATNGGVPTNAATSSPTVSAPEIVTPPVKTEFASRKTPVGRVSPVVARISAEHDIDLTQVSGTGKNGRITKQDVLAYVEQRQETASEAAQEAAQEAAPPPSVQPAVTPITVPTQQLSENEELLPHSTMRRAIARHMVESKHTSPHVTTVFEFDFSAVWAHRKAHKDQFARDGARLTFTPYLVMATAEALKVHPRVNSSWRDDGLVLKRQINIGMATAIEDGLIVPVIKGADGLNLLGLARVVADLAERARTKRLKPDEVQGGTFSITNHGVSGSLFASPIINQPQCGILGVGKIEKRVCVVDDMIAIRPKAYISFTFDHRILDGASADNFVSTLQSIIENWT
ncbi:MAG: 2-oxo acid dehydrogenase subunit E2 [Anaerolineae bacterium]|nr:2-oxo acid dehydrogenase subunit E2 [Anaerolineae bacterium]